MRDFFWRSPYIIKWLDKGCVPGKGAKMFKTFFVSLNESEHALAALQYACFLASLVKGKVYAGHIMTLTYGAAVSSGMAAGPVEYMSTPLPLHTIEDVIADQRAREEQAGRLLEKARHACTACGVACDTRLIFGDPAEEILKQARAVDLVVIGRAGAGQDRRKMSQLTEAIVRTSPQPVMIAGAPYAPPTGILVLDNGGERSLHALGFAAEIAALAGLPLYLAIVTSTASEGETVKKRACQYLHDHEIKIASLTMAPLEPSGEELIEVLDRHPNAFVLMGAFGKSRFKEWLSGGTTRTVLQEARNPLLLCRH